MRTVIPLLVCMVLAIPSGLLGQEEAPQETPVSSDVEELRARFSSHEADAATLAITAVNLLKQGDREWLRLKLEENDLSEAGVTAIVSAFKEQQDLSALSEILTLSKFDEREEVLKSASKAIQVFLAQPSTRAATVEKLLQITGKGSNEETLAALSALGDAGELSAVETLISFLEHGNETIRTQAMNSLNKLTRQDFGTDQAAWKVWWEENKHLPRHLIIEPALLTQVEQLQQENESLRSQRNDLALEIIDSNPRKAVEFLAWDEPAIRHRAAEVLSKNVSEDWVLNVTDRVIAHLERGEGDEAALKLLLSLVGSHPEKKPEAQAILLRYLETDPRDAIKVVAAQSLQGYKNEAVRKVGHDMLERLEKERDREELKEQLLDLLTAVGSGPSLPLLEHYLSSENGSAKGVRLKAARALGASGREEAIDILGKEMKKEPDRDVRSDIASSLTELGLLGSAENGMKEKAVVQLEQNLIDRESKVRSACVVGIGKLKPKNALEIFGEHLLKTETDPGVLSWYIQALGWIQDPKGLTMISKALPANTGEGDAYLSLLERTREAVIGICGDDLDLWMQSIDIFFDAGHHELTIQCCEDYLSRSKTKNGDEDAQKRVKIRRHESYVRDSLAKGDLARAYENVKVLSEQLDPENNAYLLEKARILKEMKNYGEAQVVYEQLLARIPVEQTPELWQARLELAQCLLEVGKADSVLALLEGVPEGLPEGLSSGIAEVKAKAQAVVDLEKKDAPPAVEEDRGKESGTVPEEKAEEGDEAPKEKTPSPDQGDEDSGAEVP